MKKSCEPRVQFLRLSKTDTVCYHVKKLCTQRSALVRVFQLRTYK